MKNKRLIAALILFAVLFFGIALNDPRFYLPHRAAEEEPAAPANLSAEEISGSGITTISAAKRRGAYMAELIQSDPERALEEALSLSEWSALPEEARPFVEQPFSAVADFEVLIACGEGESETRVSTRLPDGTTITTSVFGRRGEMGTKHGLPVQGVRVGGVGVLCTETFQALDAADEAAALQQYAYSPRPSDDAVAALFGGRVVYFESRAAIDDANRRVADAEALPGPGVELVSYYLEEGVFDLDGYVAAAEIAAEAWTGTPRDTYVILVDFPDRLGQPTDPVAFSNSVNTTVSQQIQEMSYGQTHIVAVVNPTTYTMPLGNEAYTNNGLLYTHATDAVAGVDLSPYETVCIFHPAIDGESYAGLASVGGKRMWLKSANTDVVIHEFGHNYGARHSSFWSVDGSDPVDPAGALSEYGDFTDIMGGGDAPEGHFNVWHKTHIGWLSAGNWMEVTNSGTYRVHRCDHPDTSAALRGLRLDKGASDFYWLGLRQEYTEYETFSRGAQLLWKKSGHNRSLLIDTTPASAEGKYDGGIALGQTYSDSAEEYHFTSVDRGGQTPNEWIDIAVNIGPFPGNAAPIASISGPTNGVTGESFVFTVSASDADGDALAYFWDTGDGLVKPNSPTLPAAWLTGETGTVSCVVSDMKGGATHVTHSVVLEDPVGSWTPRVSGTTVNLKGVAAGGGRVVAVGDNGVTCYSDDGANWVEHTDITGSATNIYLQDVAYDGSMFLAVGMSYNGGWEQTIYTSTDAENWTKRYGSNSGSGSNTKMNDVVYGGGVYIAVGDGGAIARSTDGLSWSLVASGTTIDLQGVTYGDGHFVVVGDYSYGGTNPHIVLNSTDGLSWTDQTAGTSLHSGNWLFHVEYLVDRFFAGGWSVEIHSSTNQGQSFERLLSGSYETAGYAYGAGVYFTPAENLSGGGHVNFLSYDGVNWTEQSTPALDERKGAAFFNGTFLTVGENGSIWQSGAVAAASGGFANWQLANAPALGLNRDPMDDADFDGVINLAEYAFGSSAIDAASMPAQATVDTEGAYFEVSYPRDGVQPDITYSVERLENLALNDWSAATTVATENSPTNIAARSIYSLGTQSNEFMRLRIELE